MRKVALVCAGGFCGTLARYLLMAPLLRLTGLLFPTSPNGFPYDIFIINLSGAFALGLLYGLVERGAAFAPEVRLLVGTGFLGAYTTFSTFVYGGDKLLMSGSLITGVLYLCGSIVLGVVCAWVGMFVASSITARSRLPHWRVARVRQRFDGANATSQACEQLPQGAPLSKWRGDMAGENGIADVAREEEEVTR